MEPRTPGDGVPGVAVTASTPTRALRGKARGQVATRTGVTDASTPPTHAIDAAMAC